MTDLLDDTRLAAQVRDEVRAFLADNWKPGKDEREWRELLADTGWGMPWWPKEFYGRGLPSEMTRIVAEEFAAAEAPGPFPGMGVWLAGPTIVEHGTDEQKRYFLRRIITGEDRWCQLFSEPGSGSDLAGSQTTAVLHGDEWIVNGQKVWTSGAQFATIGMLVCRTDWDVPKHRGISYLALDITQPGVDVRPLREMTGNAMFNEVFITDARVPKDWVIGGVNDGWKVAMTTLMHERASLPQVGGGRGGMPAAPRRQAQRSGNGQTEQDEQAMMAMAMMGRGWQGMAELARQRGLDRNPVYRQRIANLYVLNEVNRLNLMRAGAARKAGKPPGAEGSLAKLYSSTIARASRDLSMSLLGPGGMITGPGAPTSGMMQMGALSTSMTSIAGGTDEIQHNIIGERVLGLPKEPSVDTDMPFRDVKRNKQKGSV